MDIDIYADLVCPWCYLGKRRLETALASFDAEVTLRWRPFQLDPSTPREARPLMPWLAQHFGGEAAARQAAARATGAAAAEGLRFDYDRALIVNTFDAHRLVWFAGQPQAVFSGAGPDTQPETVEAVHRAHFTEGLDIGSIDVLASLAAGVGLDESRVLDLLASGEGEAEVRAEMDLAHRLGVTSVPLFVFANRYAVAGAQPAEVLRAALTEAAAARIPVDLGSDEGQLAPK